MTQPKSSPRLFRLRDAVKLEAPACFDTRHQYVEWAKAGRAAGETCTICCDCDTHYQLLMLSDNRCHHERWTKVTFFGRFMHSKGETNALP